MDRKKWVEINWQNKRTNDRTAFIIIGPNEKLDLNNFKRGDSH
jgi:hypothetical protein